MSRNFTACCALSRPAAGFLGNLFGLLLIVLVAQSFGLFVGGAFMDAKTAQTVTTVRFYYEYCITLWYLPAYFCLDMSPI